MSLYLRNAEPAQVGRGPVHSPTVTTRRPGGSRPAANEPLSRDRQSRAVDPMLLVYQERVRSVQLLAQMIRRGMTALLKHA